MFLTLLRPRAACAVLSALLIAASLSGCKGKDPPPVKVHGRLLKDGQPFGVNTSTLPPGDPGIRVGFIAVEGDGDIYYAKVQPDGTFDIPGPRNQGIPPGKYRITVAIGPAGTTDELKERFSRKNTPLERDITGKEEVVIDIGKSAG